jgi:tetratricopeptide (TPR) repeat protein
LPSWPSPASEWGRQRIGTIKTENPAIGLRPAEELDEASRAARVGGIAGWPGRERLVEIALPLALPAAAALAVFGLGLNDGTYGLAPRNSVAIAVWWALALAVCLSLWPLGRPPRAALVAGGLLAALAALTALSLVWAESDEKAFAEFNRVALYLGVFALVVAAAPRGSAQRWCEGIALGITALALLALVSRLYPDLIGSHDVRRFVSPDETRLTYPLNYWNGLAILTGLAFPLLLATATARRSLAVRGLALAPLPALVAVIYLTSSRGGAAAAALGTLAFLALTSRRGNAALAAVCAALGSIGVIAVLRARTELVDGPLQSAAAHSQGRSAAVLILLLCVLTGVLYALGARFLLRRPLPLSRRAGQAIAAVAVVAAIGGIVALDPIERFEQFKQSPDSLEEPQRDFIRAHLVSSNGSGRWQFWGTALDEFETRPVLGRGAGSYEAWWAEHGNLFRFIRDAHSLYLETLAELGLVGFALLLALFGYAAAVGVGRLRRSRQDERPAVAALVGLFLAFALAVGIDWMWELTVVGLIGIAAIGLLCGPATQVRSGPSSEPAPGGPARQPARSASTGRNRWLQRGPRGRIGLSVTLAVVTLALIAAQAIPLLAHNEIRASQEAADRGDAGAALESALAARRLQPWAASPHLQLALVQEQVGQLRSAAKSIRGAIDRDGSDWRLWLVRARIETKSGAFEQARQSLARARELNPRSPLFRA